jgi:hypothetical protein
VRQLSRRFFVPAKSIIQPALTVTTMALASGNEWVNMTPRCPPP